MKILRLLALALLLPLAAAATDWFPSVWDYHSFTNYIAVNYIAPGDTVHLGAGTNDWFGTVAINGWTLSGAGTNATVIVDETPTNSSGVTLITMNNQPSYLTRMTALQISVGVTNNETVNYPYPSMPATYRGVVVVNGLYSWRIDHCMFNNNTGKPILINNLSTGCIDNNSFPLLAEANAVEVFGGLNATNSTGDSSWNTPYIDGTNVVVDIENNYFSSTFNVCTIDTFDGGRTLIRSNYFSGSSIFMHGLDSGQRNRSARALEVYGNTFVYPPTGADGYAITMHGGTMVCYNNSISNAYFGMIVFQDYRITDNSPAYTPWYGATGLSGYDSNSPSIWSGTAAAGSGSLSLTVSGTPWTSGALIGVSAYDSHDNLCGIITANTANTATFLSLGQPAYYIAPAAGDSIQMHLVYPSMDQVGRGQGDLVTGNVPTPQWYNEDLEPAYFWGNIVGGTMQSGFQAMGPASAFSSYPDIQVNRDFYNSTLSYTPLVWPNPLVNTNSGGTVYSGTYVNFIH